MLINNIHFDFTSFPTHYVQENSIRIIHHGMASPDRYIHKMIEVMDYVDSRFTLDLMLVATYYQDYFETLQQMAAERQNTRIIPIVPFEEIIPFTSQYDIGMFLVPFSTFNLKMCLPNKFFEFIQARLAIAIGPSPEMSKYVKTYNLGIISKDFTPQSMAESLNKLTKEEILQYKENSNKAAKILNAQKEGEKVLKILEEVLG
ncbi:glycosyltransferase family 4 protein [Helicobacter pullorum NCTC 12824]|uniref:glycosyltransferase family 4 protein n=1 Tax=Helicobacter pullorum TaxID=35818 RepID=UPI001243F281|nr:glycosyltransferase family 4 protein [Helicobacter pullorum]KAB0574312.1 glycosyltransferase family 4 protein [Helicobacter pullorum NCTC 12824]